MAERLKQLAQHGNVFAKHQHHGDTRFAKISLDGDKLCLYQLSEEQPSMDANVIELDEALNLVNPSSRVAFLDIGSEVSHGRLIINLSPDTIAAQNFTLLCTGEMGPSYAGSKLFHIHHKDKGYEYVGGGDYEYNNGEGGKSVIPGLELGPDYERPWVPGIVRGFWGLGNDVGSQFFISTGDRYNGNISPAFGVVEEGLHHLKEAVRLHPNITEVIVKRCGIILAN